MRKLGLDQAIDAHLGLLKIHSCKGQWGYHALVLSLANTGEPLFVVNRNGNRSSHEQAAAYFDRAIALCRQAGFKKIRLRGDTDFTQTEHLDRWDTGGVKFVFGIDAMRNLYELAEKPAEEIVFEANDRCNQENLHAQLKGDVRSLTAPVDSLLSNWAHMVMGSLAWSLKAWAALVLPEEGRWQERHREEKRKLLRMDFSTFRSAMMRVPAQILTTGRKIAYRFLAWNPWQHVFFRLLDQLGQPLRC